MPTCTKLNKEANERPRIHDPEAFKVGDRVRDVGKAESGEGGWENGWNINMNDCDNIDLTVMDTDEYAGYESNWGFLLNTVEIIGTVQNYFFPSFVLEKVEP